jgi:hypothetical protein
MSDDQIIPVVTVKDLVSQNGALVVLWIVQQHGPLSILALYELIAGEPYVEPERERYGVVPEKGEVLVYMLEASLGQLQAAGLVDKQQSADGPDIYAAVHGRFEAIQRVLRLPGLEEQIRKSRNGSFYISPSFGKPDSTMTYPQVVVLMPYVAALDEFYIHNIRRVTYALELTCERIKDTFYTNSLIKKVWSAVFHSQICIADCTGGDANTFYALGIANTLGKKCILIAQSIDDIPVDLRTERTIIYENTSAGMEQFEATLSDMLRTELNLKAQ